MEKISNSAWKMKQKNELTGYYPQFHSAEEKEIYRWSPGVERCFSLNLAGRQSFRSTYSIFLTERSCIGKNPLSSTVRGVVFYKEIPIGIRQYCRTWGTNMEQTFCYALWGLADRIYRIHLGNEIPARQLFKIFGWNLAAAELKHIIKSMN